jgi:ABC-2 type transport system ATP-binding protein
MPDTIIEITDLTKEYDGNRAVDNLSLEIKKGEIFGLLGPNGAGKTTTILMMLGLTEPTSGSVKIKGCNATTEPIKVKRVTGYLPDQVGFYDYRTGLENLVYTAQLNGIPEKAAYQSAEKLLQQVGLEEVKNDKVGTYSKGMRQRLGLADVLIKEPEIIILDEPTIGIDPKGINEFLSMIRNLSKEKGITVLLSSHLLQQVQKICDRVGLFVDGKLLALGNIDELASKLFEKQENTIEAQVEGITEAIIGELKQIEGVIEVISSGTKLTIKCRQNLAPEIARRIVNNGGSLLGLSYQEYGLDEIYQYYFEGGPGNDS